MNRFNLVKLPKILISLLKLNSVCWVFFSSLTPCPHFVCVCVWLCKRNQLRVLWWQRARYTITWPCVCVCVFGGRTNPSEHVLKPMYHQPLSVHVCLRRDGRTAGRRLGRSSRFSVPEVNGRHDSGCHGWTAFSWRVLQPPSNRTASTLLRFIKPPLKIVWLWLICIPPTLLVVSFATKGKSFPVSLPKSFQDLHPQTSTSRHDWAHPASRIFKPVTLLSLFITVLYNLHFSLLTPL